MKRFRLFWPYGYGTVQPEEAGEERFCKESGYDDNDRVAIAELVVGESYTIAGPFDAHVIERIA